MARHVLTEDCDSGFGTFIASRSFSEWPSFCSQMQVYYLQGEFWGEKVISEKIEMELKHYTSPEWLRSILNVLSPFVFPVVAVVWKIIFRRISLDKRLVLYNLMYFGSK